MNGYKQCTMKFNGRDVVIGKNANIGVDVRIGDRVTIYDNVCIGDGTTVCNHAVIGEPLSRYYDDAVYVNPITRIGENSLIRSHSIIYAGNTIGKGLQTGHFVIIRENNSIGDFCKVGNYSEIQGLCQIGDYCSLHGTVRLGRNSRLGHFVMMFGFSGTADDQTPPSNSLEPVTIKSFSVIGASAGIMPAVTIGQNCVVGESSVVYEDLPANSLYVRRRIIKKLPSIQDRPAMNEHYPWMYNFDRGMPWRESGFSDWLERAIEKGYVEIEN